MSSRNTSKADSELMERISDMIGILLEGTFNQVELAENLGIYQPQVSQLYRKIGRFKPNRLIEIEKILKQLIREYIKGNKRARKYSKDIDAEFTYGDWLFSQLEKLKMMPIDFADKAKVSYQTINLILKGVTSNPQENTKTQIKKTLYSLSKTKKQKLDNFSASEENQIVTNIRFIREEVQNTPLLIGVYAIHDKRGFPTYVGKGIIKTRLTSHMEKTFFASDKVASTFSYYVTHKGDTENEKKESDKQAKIIEQVLIKFAGNTLLGNSIGTEDLSDR